MIDVASGVACWVCAGIFGWMLLDGFKTGTMTFGWAMEARRSSCAVGFWSLAAANGLFTCGALFVGATEVFRLG